MDNIFLLMVIGFVIGTFGTLIGAGGGFILVPLLILTHPAMPPNVITAISIAVVAINAISGTIAYARSKRIDYKAGLLFGAFTIPGSVIGVFLIKYIPKHLFNIVFGVLLIVLASYLLIENSKSNAVKRSAHQGTKGLTFHELTDNTGTKFAYGFNKTYGIVISFLVGFLSPMLGIGGGIIHVPAMVQWLRFPVYIATATSHFMLAIMSTVSVLVHVSQGSYMMYPCKKYCWGCASASFRGHSWVLLSLIRYKQSSLFGYLPSVLRWLDCAFCFEMDSKNIR